MSDNFAMDDLRIQPRVPRRADHDTRNFIYLRLLSYTGERYEDDPRSTPRRQGGTSAPLISSVG